MIFGHQINPITHLSAGFGAATSDTKRLRAAMIKLAKTTGDVDFGPCSRKNAATCSADGDITKTTVYGLIYAIGRLAGKVPESGTLRDTIVAGLSAIPGVGEILGPLAQGAGLSRDTVDTIWDVGIPAAMGIAAGAGKPFTDPRPKIIDFVRTKSGSLAQIIEAANVALAVIAPPRVITPGVRAFLIAQQGATQFVTAGSFPPGAVAVRDPIANVFRILAPPL